MHSLLPTDSDPQEIMKCPTTSRPLQLTTGRDKLLMKMSQELFIEKDHGYSARDAREAYEILTNQICE